MIKKKSPRSASLTHLDARGEAVMVDVSEKRETKRVAVAMATVKMAPTTFALLMGGKVPKGDVFSVARIAGILGAKQTSALIPLCHPLPLGAVHIDFQPDAHASAVTVISRVSIVARTGVEMEALTAASLAALTIYDMCKAVEKGITITDICLVEKHGGKSGSYRRLSGPNKNS